MDRGLPCQQQKLTLFDSRPTVVREVNADTEHRLTFFTMSCLVMVFVNVAFGAAALLCSIKSHRLLNESGAVPGLKAGHGTLVISSFIPEAKYTRAKRFGLAAFALNISGIFCTMIALIYVFQRLGQNDR